MSNIIKAIKFAANTNNIKIVKAMIATQGRLANIIVDRVHMAAALADNFVGAKNDPEAILDLILPGARQEIERLEEVVEGIQKQAARREMVSAIATKANITEREVEQNLSKLYSVTETVDVSNALLTGAEVIVQNDFHTVLLTGDYTFYVSDDDCPFRQTYKRLSFI